MRSGTLAALAILAGVVFDLLGASLEEIVGFWVIAGAVLLAEIIGGLHRIAAELRAMRRDEP